MLIRSASLSLLLAAAPAYAISEAEPVSDERFAQDFPWAVVVINPRNEGVCGGALIAPRWVITAAHCSSGERYVLAGSAERSSATRVDVKKIVRHPDYDGGTGQFDVALLLLAEPLDTATLEVATELESRLLLRNEAAARVLGWGRWADSRRPADRLRAADLTVSAFARTGSLYGYQGSVGPCGNDSGSPMLMRTLDGRWLLVGVARAARGMCGVGSGQAVYLDVGRVTDFVRASTGVPAEAQTKDSGGQP